MSIVEAMETDCSKTPCAYILQEMYFCTSKAHKTRVEATEIHTYGQGGNSISLWFGGTDP